MSIFEKRKHLRLIEKDSVLPGHRILVVPGAVNLSGFIEGNTPVFDTPGVCRFDFVAQVVKHSDAMLSQSPPHLHHPWGGKAPGIYRELGSAGPGLPNGLSAAVLFAVPPESLSGSFTSDFRYIRISLCCIEQIRMSSCLADKPVGMRVAANSEGVT